ncbi:hypothetical protein ACTJJ0_22275 [Chitinophaga sp. 22321]|uniref:hypothetical protein n=1 Tax=Chitinophaga sp. 22321 TaxID=3453909 RepID=UPI003F833CCB
MINPNQEQIAFVRQLLIHAIGELIANDRGIFGQADVVMPADISEDAKTLYRRLHEVTINHRFAYYLEKHLRNGPEEYNHYHVDIEYNRNYGELKNVQTVEGALNIRPDIIVHSRINETVNPQHLLAIEAKKDRITQRDIAKVTGLITDPRYSYVFGLTISYSQDPNRILGTLYYHDGRDMERAELNVDIPAN